MNTLTPLTCRPCRHPRTAAPNPQGLKTLLTDSEDASFLANVLIDQIVDGTLPMVQVYARRIAALEVRAGAGARRSRRRGAGAGEVAQCACRTAGGVPLSRRSLCLWILPLGSDCLASWSHTASLAQFTVTGGGVDTPCAPRAALYAPFHSSVQTLPLRLSLCPHQQNSVLTDARPRAEYTKELHLLSNDCTCACTRARESERERERERERVCVCVCVRAQTRARAYTLAQDDRVNKGRIAKATRLRIPSGVQCPGPGAFACMIPGALHGFRAFCPISSFACPLPPEPV
jgi:hypothetical protein